MSNKIIILGTDTDTGKTSFALLWMAAFGNEFDYWKPLETGESDTLTIRTLVPNAFCHPPAIRLVKPVAPPLAAQLEGKHIPDAASIARKCPHNSPNHSSLLVETFGSPFSSLNDSELQLALIERLASPTILISSSALGAIGRTLSCLIALRYFQHAPVAVVLMGKHDQFAADEIRKHGVLPVFSLEFPDKWSSNGIIHSSRKQIENLEKVRELFSD